MAGVIEGLKTLGRGSGRTRLAAAALLVLMLIPAACSGADSESAADGGGGGDAAEAPASRALGDGESQWSGNGGGGGGSGMAASTTSEGPGAGDDYAFEQDALGSPGSTGASSAARLPKFGPSVIKTATVSIGLPKDEIGGALNEAVSIAGRSGGFVLSSTSGRGDSRGTLTMRIPAQRFEAALGELESLGKVRSEKISGQDVSQDFVDLEARLRNWESQEAVLLKLMGRAVSVQDTIRVQGQLSRVQLEIEQIRGRLRFLRDQTSYGTITATFGPVTPVPSTPGRFAKAWERAVDLMQGFVEAVIVASGVVLPLALLAFLAYVIFRSLRPRLSA